MSMNWLYVRAGVTMMHVDPMQAPNMVKRNPDMWVIGFHAKNTSVSSDAVKALPRIMFATKDRCVISTPFGKPVVPDV